MTSDIIYSRNPGDYLIAWDLFGLGEYIIIYMDRPDTRLCYSYSSIVDKLVDPQHEIWVGW